MAETIFLPEEMAPFRTQLEQTQRNIIRITTEETENPLSVYTSKLGGKPYFPLSEKYPYNNQGQPLYMIAQINFSTLSQNSEILAKISEDSYLKHLPIKGILSFFIDYHDDLLGSNFGNPDDPTSYKIFYFPEIETDETKLITDFSFLETENANFMPMLANHEEYAFNFQIERQLVTLESFEWMNIMDKDSYDFIEELTYSKDRSSDDVYEEYSEAYSGGHHVGGYPYFTQEDPRNNETTLQAYNFLLLQLDSDDYIMWGDCGVANFFINFEKLKQQDFSDVLYTWDCC